MRLRLRSALILAAAVLAGALAAVLGAWGAPHAPSWLLGSAAAAALGAIWGAGVLLTRLWVLRPLNHALEQLRVGAVELACARYSHRLPEPDEAGLAPLYEAFNHLAAGVEAANEQLLAMFAHQLERVEQQGQQLQEAQDQVLRSQRLAAIGDLAAGFAHEVSNPLQIVLGNAQLLCLDLEEGGEQREGLEAIARAANRIAHIVGTLQTLANAERSARETVDLGVAVRAAAEAMGKEATGSIDLRLELSAGPLWVLGQKAALVELVGHLLRNACTATAGRATRRLRLVTCPIAGAAAQLEVSDTGCGIPQQHLERLFTPFFTSKREWSGLGLGLSLCHRIVEDHGGRLTIDSEVGLGTTVRVVLPLAQPPPRSA